MKFKTKCISGTAFSRRRSEHTDRNASWNQRFFSGPAQLIRDSHYMVLPQTFPYNIFKTKTTKVTHSNNKYRFECTLYIIFFSFSLIMSFWILTFQENFQTKNQQVIISMLNLALNAHYNLFNLNSLFI